MKPYSAYNTEEILINAVHDIRQPLGTIETSAYMLSLWLRDGPENVREQLRVIERQVDLAGHVLLDAAAQLRLAQAQRAEEESFDLTNSEIALVT